MPVFVDPDLCVTIAALADITKEQALIQVQEMLLTGHEPIFYCQVELRSNRVLLAEYVVDAPDWYYARHKAAERYKKNYPNDFRDWCVDSYSFE